MGCRNFCFSSSSLSLFSDLEIHRDFVFLTLSGNDFCFLKSATPEAPPSLLLGPAMPCIGAVGAGWKQLFLLKVSDNRKCLERWIKKEIKISFNFFCLYVVFCLFVFFGSPICCLYLFFHLMSSDTIIKLLFGILITLKAVASYVNSQAQMGTYQTTRFKFLIIHYCFNRSKQNNWRRATGVLLFQFFKLVF